jgi:hypothetical protein
MFANNSLATTISFQAAAKRFASQRTFSKRSVAAGGCLLLLSFGQLRNISQKAIWILLPHRLP